MKTIVKLIFASMLMIVAAPAYAGQAVQVFVCQINEDVTEAVLIQRASEWLKAAKTVKGGENLKASLHDPVAAEMGQNDVLFVIVAPSLTEWGTFWDNYRGSAADKLDKDNDDVVCPKSRLFESVVIE
ncbi:MAG: hypothetical protein ACR2OJ_04640 [Hyphomicrobiales bacterium]